MPPDSRSRPSFKPCEAPATCFAKSTKNTSKGSFLGLFLGPPSIFVARLQCLFGPHRRHALGAQKIETSWVLPRLPRPLPNYGPSVEHPLAATVRFGFGIPWFLGFLQSNLRDFLDLICFQINQDHWPQKKTHFVKQKSWPRTQITGPRWFGWGQKLIVHPEL